MGVKPNFFHRKAFQVFWSKPDRECGILKALMVFYGEEEEENEP